MSWGYTSTNGPSQWVQQFPIADGERQSPIDIQTGDTQYDPELEGSAPLTTYYRPEIDMTLTNTGASMMASMKQRSELTGGPLNETYCLAQFHLHWGSVDTQGSEHTIDKEMYAAELHLVHWNSKYGSFADAADKSDGLAVIGVMIKPGSENSGFKAVSDSLSQVPEKGCTCTVSGSFDPTNLLPAIRNQYWTYEGSLTTPPLFESVQWIVMKQPVEYSVEQLTALRSLQSEASNIQDNYRPPCPLRGRAVRASFE